APDPCDCYKRSTSVIPQQALALVNNELVLGLSRQLADRLWSELEGPPGDREHTFVRAAFEQVLARPPSDQEHAVITAFLGRQVRLFQAAIQPATSVDAAARARGDLIHALFNHNDFITIH